jgi:hypothetical protein
LATPEPELVYYGYSKNCYQRIKSHEVAITHSTITAYAFYAASRAVDQAAHSDNANTILAKVEEATVSLEADTCIGILAFRNTYTIWYFNFGTEADALKKKTCILDEFRGRCNRDSAGKMNVPSDAVQSALGKCPKVQ